MVNQGRSFPKGVFGMTRDEQMWEAVAKEHGDLSMRDALVTLTAMEWADKTMIEKVCDWFQCMALDYMQGDITDVKWASMFADLSNYIENGDN